MKRCAGWREGDAPDNLCRSQMPSRVHDDSLIRVFIAASAAKPLQSTIVVPVIPQ
jgi:hypothetical protein